jgi:hypothetical protein
MDNINNSCVHMFSGGRDSTLAAVRLAQKYEKLVLITVTTANLVGFERVCQRLIELKPHLPGNTEWLHIALPPGFVAYRQSALTTCLPCHHVYLVTGAIVAGNYNSKHLALGYTGYQSTWTEQSPYAIERLSEIMSTIGLRLILPVADLVAKEQAIAELRANNLSEGSLEQKCIRQVNDAGLPFDLLRQEIDRWGEDLKNALDDRQNLHLDILDRKFISELPEK